MPRPPRKKQQRLAFTPIPSSSPAAKGYHKQIQDRAAAVTLQGSPSSGMRQTRQTVDLVSDDEVPIPTPAASQDLTSKANRESDQESSSENEQARSTQRLASTRRKRPRQQRLDFNNAREPSSFDSPFRLPSTTRTRSSNKAGMFSSQVPGNVGRFSDEESNDGSEELPSPRKMLRARKSARKSTKKSHKKSKDNDGEGSANEGHAIRTSRAAAEEDVDDDEIVVTGSRQQDPSKQHEEDSGDDTDMPTTQRRRKTRPSQSVKSPSGSPMHISNDDEDDDDDMPTTQGRQRRGTKRARRNSFISDSPPIAIGSEDDVAIVASRKRTQMRSEDEAQSEDDEDDEDDALPKTPGRRGLVRHRKQLTQREKEDLEEDLDFLGPSDGDDDDSSNGRAPRNTQSAQKSAKQQALERLKRARAGQEDHVEDQVLGEEHEEEGQTGDEEGDEDLPEDDLVDYTSSRQFFQERDEDAEFVEEEEEEGPLGVPAGIPLEFTRYASLKPKELFRYAVDWMLQKHINPGFQRRDPLYELTFRKLDDEAQGLAGSKFKSSAWTSAFRYALEARPQLDIAELDSIEMEDHDKCDACNRASHQCTFSIRFHGKPYYSDSLEDLASDDDSDSDDDDDSHASNVNYNTQGNKIVGTDHFFYVGRFCKGNALTSHALQHWRYHLNEFVHGYLSTAGYFEAKELKKRQGWSIKKLGKYANKVLEGMEREGEVNKLWKMFRSNIDEARESKGGKFRGNSP